MTSSVAGLQQFEHDGVTVRVLVTGPVQENSFLVTDAAGEGYLIDPGDDAGRILSMVKEAGARVHAILLTHAHFDHIGAVQAVRETLNVPVLLHPRDLDLYRNGGASAARWGIPFVQPGDPDGDIRQDQVFGAGSLQLTARELPGHAPGHVVFLARGASAGDGLVIAGDTLFRGGVGRTDLPGGNHPQLLAGIRNELLSLPDTVTVYPGHGARTTVGAERRSNPFLD